MGATGHRMGRLKQLAEFRSAFFQAILAVLVSYFIFVLIFYSLATSVGVADTADSVWTWGPFGAYLVISGTGVVLYLSASEFDDEGGDEEEEPEIASVEDAFEAISEGKPLREMARLAFEQSLEGLAAFTFISLLITIGATVGLLVTNNISGFLGTPLALIYPILDVEIGQKARWYVSPSLVLTVISFVILVPAAAVITLAGGAFGALVGASIGIPLVFASFIYELMKTSGIAETIHRPFEGFRRRSPQ